MSDSLLMPLSICSLLCVVSLSPSQDFTSDFYFRQAWRDSRLSFVPRPGIEALFVGAEVIEKIWVRFTSPELLATLALWFVCLFRPDAPLSLPSRYLTPSLPMKSQLNSIWPQHPTPLFELKTLAKCFAQ